MTQPIPVKPGQPRVQAKLFWASANEDGTLAPSTVDLQLSNDPALRAKQVLNVLLAGPVDTELRTLPTDAVLLAFYLMPDGTAVADFSEALATETPSGIMSEQMAVDSITRTLEANVPKVERLKILIHGQEVETLAGHLDLMGTFLVDTKGALGATTTGTTTPGTSTPTTAPAAAPDGQRTSPTGNGSPAPAAAEKPKQLPGTPNKPGTR